MSQRPEIPADIIGEQVTPEQCRVAIAAIDHAAGDGASLVGGVPVRVAVATLQDYCEETAQKAGLLREGTAEGDTKEKQIIYLVTRKADEERLPVRADNVEVRLTSQRCVIIVKYTVVLDFGVYKYDWKVEHNVDRILF